MSIRKSITDKLLANTTLVNMLAENVATWKTSTTPSKLNSIFHRARLSQEMKPNFITLDFGDSIKPQPSDNVEYFGDLLYIRAYITKGSGYMNAAKMLHEVYASLHDADIEGDDYETPIRLELVTTGADLYDEGIAMEYKQATYRILKLI